MKKAVILFSVALLSLGMTGCGKSHDESKGNTDVKTSQTSRSNSHRVSEQAARSASQRSQEQGSSASVASEQRVINSADDAASLIAHSMAADDSLYHAVPVTGGFEVTRPDTGQKAFVSYAGTVTWDDGTTQSYAAVSAPENNERANNTFAPSGN